MTTRTRPRRGAADRASAIQAVVVDALDDMKAVNIKILDVRGLTDIADVFVIASGNSDRHVRSIADRVVEKCKQAGYRPYGKEGARDGEWVLVDLNDIIVHVMLPRVRELYALESLWEAPEVAPRPTATAPARKPRKPRKAAPRKAAPRKASAKRAKTVGKKPAKKSASGKPARQPARKSTSRPPRA